MDETYIQQFTQSYIVAALWSSIDSDGEPLDSKYDSEDLAPETLEKMSADCTQFIKDNQALLEKANYNSAKHSDAAMAGHDFWLTRCGHGTGFWDMKLGEVGDKLTEACQKLGNVDLYVGDDKKIYIF